MANAKANRVQWDEEFDWELQKYWSVRWGGDAMQWYGVLLPRIHAFVPTGTILEIGPGFGRNTQYLVPLCDKLILVDLSPKCIAACKERFGTSGKLEYHCNDGVSLDMVAPGSVDFVFSFESMVHADEGTLSAYIAQLADKLTPDGVAFVHHSNLGAYRRHYRFYRTLRPALHRMPKVQRAMRRWIDDAVRGWRDPSVSAERVRNWCAVHGLRCVSQEMITHFTRYLLKDCFSLMAKPGSRWDREPVVMENRWYEQEARRLAQLAALYGRTVR
jgi:SAM-dependent methyltransferase